MIWSLLQTDEKKELLQLGQTDIGTPESQQALVAQDLAVQIGAESAADPLRKALVASGRRVLKDKEKVESTLNLKVGRRLWRSVAVLKPGAKKGGRPSKVNDPELRQKVREFLLSNSTVTAHFMRVKHEMVSVRSLCRSKRRLWKLNVDMQKAMSLSVWLRRLKVHHPQFRKFKKKVDMCPICHKYDKLVAPKISKGVERALHGVKAVQPSYFEPMRVHWENMQKIGRADPDGEASLQYVKGARQFIDNAMAARLRERTANRTAEELANLFQLREAELVALTQLKELQSTLEVCEHHFHSVQRQHICREQWEEEMPEDSVLIQMDYAENLTIPLGPTEEQTWFWATSRLSLSTLGIYVRYNRGSAQVRRYFHYISQILDHTALHAATALLDIWKRLALDPAYKHVHIWTDCGPHYRAYAFVGAGIQLLKQYGHLSNVFFHYFTEHHGKGRNDGQFGLQRRWIQDYAMRKTISTVEDLLAALKEGAAETMRSDPPPAGPEYNINHFRPEFPKTFLYLDAASADLKIEYTYCVGLKRISGPAFQVRLKNFIYSDRCFQAELGISGGTARCIEKVPAADDWRLSYRQEKPETDPLPEPLLQRRLEHQKPAKTFLASRKSDTGSRLLKQEQQQAQYTEPPGPPAASVGAAGPRVPFVWQAQYTEP
ncbi:unnamed protein product [Durusdinium trenchii]|uniref:Integrase catalytic domain-containing protein n=1 Tax=Durusdinium trenchii TaxID=1381693 RepID=A0ABP0LYV7_9DINO